MPASLLLDNPHPVEALLTVFPQPDTIARTPLFTEPPQSAICQLADDIEFVNAKVNVPVPWSVTEVMFSLSYTDAVTWLYANVAFEAHCFVSVAGLVPSSALIVFAFKLDNGQIPVNCECYI
jgi:hypothetical protein